MLQIFNCIILTISLSEIWRRFLHHFENGHLRPLFCLSSVFVQQIYYKVSIWYLGLAFKLTRSKSRVSLYYKRAHPCFSLYCAMAGRFNLTVSSISFANIVPKCRAMAFPFILSIVASLVRVSPNKWTKYGPEFFYMCSSLKRNFSFFVSLSTANWRSSSSLWTAKSPPITIPITGNITSRALLTSFPSKESSGLLPVQLLLLLLHDWNGDREQSVTAKRTEADRETETEREELQTEAPLLPYSVC